MKILLGIYKKKKCAINKKNKMAKARTQLRRIKEIFCRRESTVNVHFQSASMWN